MRLHPTLDRPSPAPHRFVHDRMLVVLEHADRPARQARHLLAGQLEQLGLLPAEDCPARRRADDALLVASELVTNACRHTSGPTRLTSRWNPENHSFTVSVFDPSGQLPRRAPEEERGAHGGYGMALVEVLCDRWSVTSREARGKAVSATVSFPAPPPARRAARGGRPGDRADR
ncbi:ATP-binding protein [Streptomyces sp. NPDC098789]|uniref:ATP-binding protein n=1 Tax=Streptomyces sp. NPDC098789 TaxID=3366098 RepID=UPI0038221165